MEAGYSRIQECWKPPYRHRDNLWPPEQAGWWRAEIGFLFYLLDIYTY